MNIQTDKTHANDWLSDAACVGSLPRITWHWAEAPSEASAAPALSVCASCDVVKQCRQDMANRGERYRFQVRGGLRMWVDDDVSMLPDAVLSYEAPPVPKRSPGRPATGFAKSTHLQEKYPLRGPDVNRDEYPVHAQPVAARRRADGSNRKEGQDAKDFRE